MDKAFSISVPAHHYAIILPDGETLEQVRASIAHSSQPNPVQQVQELLDNGEYEDG